VAEVDIRVPKLNSNDVTYVLVEWLAVDGERVDADTPVAVVETAKAAEELPAGAAGVLQRTVDAGAECGVGTVIGRVFAAEPDRLRFLASPVPSSVPSSVPAGPSELGVTVTEPARALAVELGVDPARLTTLGVPVVRRADVLRLADRSTVDGEVLELPRGQLAVADAVSRSHAGIPAAFTVVKVGVDAALEYCRAATRRERALVGLPELVLAALGAVAAEFPVFFATPTGGRTMRRATGAHVAVTVDVGSGLYLPVVRDCDRRGLGAIAADVMRLRRIAMRGRYRDADLRDATIVLSLNTDDGVLLTQPIVAPGTVCAVSLGAVQHEPVLDAATGTLRNRATVLLGAAYDHRYVNGGDAVRFLKALKAALERPDFPPDPRTV
jgi:2-oxoglutarate dehydrogenase E2 component (dihydrolipoamide succinyltransferase)